MLAWYLNQISDHGITSATVLLARVVWRRAFVVLSNSVLPAKRTCPCCGWQGRRFFDYIEMGYAGPNAACPRCDSHSRHRALFVWLRDQYLINEKRGTALVFAPEKALAHLWRTAPSLRVYRVDLEPARGVDVLADLMRLPFPSGIASLVWCHHVLDQVEDARVALDELGRILRSGTGELIVSVASGTQEETVEFGFCDKSLSGRRRVFGSDFADRLAEAGFKVSPLNPDLTEDQCRKYGIRAEPFFLCTKN